MKKIISILLLITTLLTVVSCSKSNTPKDMDLASKPKKDGYYFYVPENWTVNRLSGIITAYASRADRTSISLAPIDMSEYGTSAEDYFFSGLTRPEDTRPKVDEVDKELGYYTKDQIPDGYFKDSYDEFPDSIKLTAMSATLETFGKVDAKDENSTGTRAIKYVFNYKHGDELYGFIQYFVKNGDRYFILTYSSRLEEISAGKTYYDYHMSRFDMVVKNFKFTKSPENQSTSKEYPKDKDGYILISNKKNAGFSLYVPDSFTPDFSSAVVSATHTDGSNLTMSRSTMPGIYIALWNDRKEEYESTFENFKVVEEITNESKIDFGNAYSAYRCSYTFTHNGTNFKVMQVYVIDQKIGGKVYEFTYTAKDVNFDSHIEEINKVIEKVKF